MLTTGQGTYYCKYCGYDMKAREDRTCVVTDGDICIVQKYAPLRDLKANHPRVVEAKKQWLERGCQHRLKCKTFKDHLDKS